MIIDSHCHVIATDTKRYPLKPLFGKQSDWSAEHPLDYPDMVKADVEAGVDKAILVQASSAYAFDNSYVADSVAAHPEHFTGVFSVDVVAPDAVQKMKHWMGKGLTQLVRVLFAGIRQTDEGEEPVHLSPDLPLALIRLFAERKRHIVEDRHRFEKRSGLEHHPEPVAEGVQAFPGEKVDVHSVHEDLPAVRAGEPDHVAEDDALPQPPRGRR